MDVTTENVAPREVEITIHPEAAQVDEARRKAATKVGQRVRIPGFRPGKAPYVLVERTVGKEILTEEAAELLAPDLYKQALEQGGLQPFDQPSLRITQQEPLEIKIRVSLQPTVELGDYGSMRIDPESEPAVTDQQIDETLAAIRQQQGTWVPVERAAVLGDLATMDIKSTAEGETVSAEKESSLELSEALSPPGFGAAIVGMEAGQTREFTLTYADDAPQKELAGRTVDFAVTMRGLKERKLPPLDDELAKTVGQGSLAELRNRLAENLKSQQQADARARLVRTTLDRLVAQSKIEYPNLAVEQQIDNLVEQQEERLRRQGFTLEGYLRAVHKSVAQMRDELRAQAEEDVRRSLVLREVARAERVEVKPDELTTELNRVASSYGPQAEQARQALMQSGPLAAMFNELYTRKATDRLIDIVTGKVASASEAPAEENALVEQAPAAEAPKSSEQTPAEPTTAETPAAPAEA